MSVRLGMLRTWARAAKGCIGQRKPEGGGREEQGDGMRVLGGSGFHNFAWEGC